MSLGPNSRNTKSLLSNVDPFRRFDITNGAAGDLLSSGAVKSLDPRRVISPIISGGREFGLAGLDADLLNTAIGFAPTKGLAPPRISRAEPQIDRRLRIKAKTKQTADRVYGSQSADNILSIFHTTNGVIFPYTPLMNVSYMADWSPIQLTHSNYQTQAYSRSYMDSISISAQFTAQNEQEAFYSFAAAHFFKSMTKMHYGASDSQAGATPPVLALTGYGNGVFNDLPVVVTGFAQEYNDSVDMVKVTYAGGAGTAWIPTLSMLIITLSITHDLRRVRDEFNLDQFKSGALLVNNKGF